MTGKVTMRELKAEIDRVFGSEAFSPHESAGRLDYPAFCVQLRGGRHLTFEAKTRMASRRLALETLRRMGPP